MSLQLTTRIKVLTILAVLAFALFLLDFRQPRSPQSQAAGGGSAGSESRAPEAPAAVWQPVAVQTKAAPRPVVSAEARRALEERSRGPWGRDPFGLEAARLRNQTEAPPTFASTLHVSGIVWDTTRIRAVINDSVVRVGDEVDGIRIVLIERDSVTVAKGGLWQTIRLGE